MVGLFFPVYFSRIYGGLEFLTAAHSVERAYAFRLQG